LSSQESPKIPLFIYWWWIRTSTTVDISRELIVDRLGSVTYDRFLFYVMGPYKSFNLEYVLGEEELAGDDANANEPLSLVHVRDHRGLVDALGVSWRLDASSEPASG
jgi:hypothetical protein